MRGSQGGGYFPYLTRFSRPIFSYTKIDNRWFFVLRCLPDIRSFLDRKTRSSPVCIIGSWIEFDMRVSPNSLSLDVINSGCCPLSFLQITNYKLHFIRLNNYEIIQSSCPTQLYHTQSQKSKMWCARSRRDVSQGRPDCGHTVIALPLRPRENCRWDIIAQMSRKG